MTIPQWTGKEIRALRAARRMSVRAFADHLGVSDRMVSKWENGAQTARPRSLNQAALDTSLAGCGPATRARFHRLVGGMAALIEDIYPGDTVRHLVRHPIDGKLMTLVEPGPFTAGRGDPLWLPGYYIDVLPTSGADYLRFVTATDHRAPAQWPDGIFVESLTDKPVQVPWVDAQAYVVWASKALPTPAEWDRAANGDEGMVGGELIEWCAGHRGPRRHDSASGPSAPGHPTFRCVLPVEEMLALLAI
jgi:transcriptional regulator with XRE-family HTH domain